MMGLTPVVNRMNNPQSLIASSLLIILLVSAVDDGTMGSQVGRGYDGKQLSDSMGNQASLASLTIT